MPVGITYYHVEVEAVQRVFEERSSKKGRKSAAKMVKKAAFHVGEALGWDEERTAAYFAERTDPYMSWNRATGNAYTASLWVSVAEALVGRAEGDRLAAFSYGSGFGAELLRLTAGPLAADGAWAEDVEKDLAERQVIDAAAYVELRGEKAAVAV